MRLARLVGFCAIILAPNVAIGAEHSNAAALAALVAAYPDHFAAIEGNNLVWRDGTRMPIDDGIAGKELDALLDAPDIEDQFSMPYPAGAAALPPARNFDPGRVRYEPLFRKMYGDCRKGGMPKLATVRWLPSHRGGSVTITTINGIDKALAAVSAELDRLPASFTRYLIPSSGTFNCRAIAGTSRMSMHAYAAAIDINTRFTDYWRWSKPDAAGNYPFKNRIPAEIVAIFEKHGFIWGGRWYHYDTMHFEFRPELIEPGR